MLLSQIFRSSSLPKLPDEMFEEIEKKGGVVARIHKYKHYGVQELHCFSDSMFQFLSSRDLYLGFNITKIILIFKDNNIKNNDVIITEIKYNYYIENTKKTNNEYIEMFIINDNNIKIIECNFKIPKKTNKLFFTRWAGLFKKIVIEYNQLIEYKY